MPASRILVLAGTDGAGKSAIAGELNPGAYYGPPRARKMTAISKFKTTCLYLLDRVKKIGQPVLITKQGQSIAPVVPPLPSEPLAGSAFGSMAGRGKVLGDIVEPLGEDDWEVYEVNGFLLDHHVWLWYLRGWRRRLPRRYCGARASTVTSVPSPNPTVAGTACGGSVEARPKK